MREHLSNLNEFMPAGSDDLYGYNYYNMVLQELTEMMEKLLIIINSIKDWGEMLQYNLISARNMTLFPMIA